MFTAFPLGLLVTSLVFDILFLVSRNTGLAFASFALITGGVPAGVAAAVFGTVDLLAVPRGTRARSVGLWHAVTALAVLALFAGSWAARFLADQSPTAVAMAFSFGGVLLALLAGWLGQELVGRLGISVDPGAHANAPSSLSGQPASEQAHPLPPRVVPFPRERHT
jgi:uncharacterized membrane protein